MASKSRFNNFTDSEITKKKRATVSKHTTRCDKKWDKCFRQYLEHIDCASTEYWCYPDKQLDDILAKFWFNVRSTTKNDDGQYEMYTISSLRNLRNGLTRELNKHGRMIDLTKDPRYKNSQVNFKNACKELKDNGKGVVKSHTEIKHADLRKLYTSPSLDPDGTPDSLQNKVQMDIRFYFIRRGNENVNTYKKNTFILKTDPNTKLRYVVKEIDEITKNHQDDGEMITAHMPEVIGSKFCPVSSFMKYTSKLHPRSDYLWQHAKPVNKISDADIWYKGTHIGENPLCTFMSRMSREAELSMVYTNQSIRSTGITFLKRNHYTDKQIMAISGHKSINSLSIYQKVSSDEKLCMGMSMSYYLQSDNPVVYIPPPPLQEPAISHAQNIIVPYQDQEYTSDDNSDIAEIWNSIEKDNLQLSQVSNNKNVTTTMQRQTIVNMPRIQKVVSLRDVIPRSAKKRNLALEKEKQNDSEFEREIAQEDMEEEIVNMPRIEQVVSLRDVIPRSAKKRNLALDKEKQNDSEIEREIAQEDIKEERDDSVLDVRPEIADEELDSNQRKRLRLDSDAEDEDTSVKVRINPITGINEMEEQDEKEIIRHFMEEEEENSERDDSVLDVRPEIADSVLDVRPEIADSVLDVRPKIADEELDSNQRKRLRLDSDAEDEDTSVKVRINPITGIIEMEEQDEKEFKRQFMEEEEEEEENSRSPYKRLLAAGVCWAQKTQTKFCVPGDSPPQREREENSESFYNLKMLTGDESEFKLSLSSKVITTCGHLSGILHKDRFLCPGLHSECIELNGKIMVTPKTFSILGGKQSLKDWKNAVRIDGMCIGKLMDAGGLDFADHKNNCTGKCVSRHPGVSKYDTKMFLQDGTNGLPTSVPLVNSVGKEQAYQVLRDTIGENSLNQPVLPGKIESSAFPAGVVIKREVTSDNEEDSTEMQDPRASKKLKIMSTSGSSVMASLSLSDKNTMQLVNDLPSFDEMVEDSQTFWRGILEIGMVDTFFKEMKKDLDVLKNDLITYRCREEDAKKCSDLVSNLGSMTRLKGKLAVHKTDTEKQNETLRMEIEALKRKVAESEEKTKELDRKSDCFVQLLDIGKSKSKGNSSSVSNSPSTPRPETAKEISNGSDKTTTSETEIYL